VLKARSVLNNNLWRHLLYGASFIKFQRNNGQIDRASENLEIDLNIQAIGLPRRGTRSLQRCFLGLATSWWSGEAGDRGAGESGGDGTDIK
jgi:hypothetical protein